MSGGRPHIVLLAMRIHVLCCRYEDRQKARESRDADREDREDPAQSGEPGAAPSARREASQAEPFESEVRMHQPVMQGVEAVWITALNRSLPLLCVLQIFTIDQLHTYLKKFIATEEVAVAVAAKAFEVPQGVRYA